jgi:hypothetical protein
MSQTYICQWPVKHGGKRYETDGPILLSDEHARDLLAGSAIRKPTPDELLSLQAEQGIVETDNASELEKVVAAIAELTPDDNEQWTNGGKPDANHLSTKLGFTVSAAMRDEAFELSQSQDND